MSKDIKKVYHKHVHFLQIFFIRLMLFPICILLLCPAYTYTIIFNLQGVSEKTRILNTTLPKSSPLVTPQECIVARSPKQRESSAVLNILHFFIIKITLKYSHTFDRAKLEGPPAPIYFLKSTRGPPPPLNLVHVFQKINALCQELQSSRTNLESSYAYTIVDVRDAYMCKKWHLNFMFFVRHPIG